MTSTTPSSGRVARAGAVVAALLLAGSGAYLTADAYDVVPGLVTLAPAPEPPPPFPSAPAAVSAPEATAVVDPLEDDDAPLPAAEQVTAEAAAAAAHEWMGPSVGIVVTDLLTGEVLADVDGATPRVPASTAKILTAAAAISALGPDRTLPTTVRLAGDAVVLVGGGDVMLAAGAGDPTAVNGRAGVVDLAAQVARHLRLAGRTSVRVVVDDGLFTGPTVAPGWADTDLGSGYVAPVTAVAVNIAKTREEPYPPRHRDPSLHAGRVLADALVAAGIEVAGEPRRGTAPDEAEEVARVESAPVRDVVRYALHTSDNTVAEVLGRLVAIEAGLPGSFAGATAAVLREVESLGVDLEGARLADCSGLADGSALSATQLVELLRVVSDPGRSDLRVVAVDLPVSGWHGTLADRLEALPALGVVRAKTGSLRGVTSLAGTVLTAEGRPLVFAVIADQTPPGGQLGPRRVTDTFVQQLAGCGCSLP